eukprot:TRINITY_DN3910_c1_g4_i1.p1 TRINITY_DN3910_c1_g4~~TRINITY_DN3910_c1_g4_i1.p1  ORF type:complete len:541 (+),score=86.04 TRINITY_DN3910_c1_g4_i1:53-1624(+)
MQPNAAALLLLSALAVDATLPNILMVVIDDLGYDDMGYKALQPQIKTPNVDAFAHEGTILDQYYVQPSCSPTRTTILSGRYPLHTGIDSFIPVGQPWGLAQNETTLADMLLAGGYATHAIGKWHAGMYSYKVTPTFRGFQSFYGFYNGGEDYFTHLAGDQGYDMRRDVGLKCGKNCSHIETEADGKYSTILFSQEAVKVVEAHDVSQPLFLYLAYQAVHAPDQAPDSYVEPYKNLGGNRAIYGGMLACMDEGFGNVTAAMKAKNMMDNTILIFTADNGGPTETCAVQGSSNWPLRGSKCSIWEGGTRASAFLWTGPSVTQGQVEKGTTFQNLMHCADWMPTISTLTGIPCPTCFPWDGVKQWDALTKGGTPARDNIYYGITDEQVGNHGPAMRVGCYKLIIGDGGKPGGWHPPPNGTCGDSCQAVEVFDHPSFSVEETPLPPNPNGTMLLFDLCSDPDEHAPLEHNSTTSPIIQSIHNRILNMWQTASTSCPQFQCEGRAPNGCKGGRPIEINGRMVWEPWCE